MRIVAGKYGRLRIRVPSGNRVRPTPDRVREAVFSIIGSAIEDARVLDLFAGSGALGMESLSRGASHATFVEKDRRHARILRDNLDHIKCPSSDVDVVVSDVLGSEHRLHSLGQFEWIFLDPPYGKGMVNETFERISKGNWLAPGGTVVVDHPKQEELSLGQGWSVEDRRVYGEVAVAWVKAMAMEGK